MSSESGGGMGLLTERDETKMIKIVEATKMKRKHIVLLALLAGLVTGCNLEDYPGAKRTDTNDEIKDVQSGNTGDPIGELEITFGEYNGTPIGGTEVSSPFAPGYSVNDDPDEIGWISVSNKTLRDFEASVQAYQEDGYFLRDLEVYFVDGQKRFAGIFHKNDKGKQWGAFLDRTQTQFNEKLAYYENNGFRLIDQEIYVEGGTRYYAGVWLENPDALPVESFRDKTGTQFSELFQTYKSEGYMPVDFETYVYNGTRYYAAIWNKNVKDVSWKFYRNQTEDEYKADYAAFSDDFRIQDLEIYLMGSNQRYAAIWVQNTNNRYWKVRRKLSAKTFSDYWYRSRDEGYRIAEFVPYTTLSGIEYATVWRQNTNRPQWNLKSQIDQIVEDFHNDNQLPSLAIGIAKDGEFMYLRGQGYADLENDQISHSRTVYRIASGSKAVAGVIVAKIASKTPGFDIKDLAKSYLPGLPDGHDYSVGDLVTNRSGMGAYNEYVDEPTDTAFANAWDASQFLITGLNEPLPFSIGSYNYSTHGYTILGAVLEAMENKTIFDIVKDEITYAHNLPSLKAVIKNESVPFRAAIYQTNDTDNTPVAEDDISWKVLGGGLEASLYDYTRFGMKLLNGEIIDNNMMNAMWTPPDPDTNNYAFGWNTGTTSDKDGLSTRMNSKLGGALGSSSYIRVFPDKNIVLVAMTNRRMQPGNNQTAPIQVLSNNLTSVLMSEY